MFVVYNIGVFYETECTSGDLVMKQWTIIYFIGYLQDGDNDAARSRDDWDFYERAGEKFASIEPHISDTISHLILSLQEFVVKKLSFPLTLLLKKSKVHEW